MTPTNAQIAELLARSAEDAVGYWQRALRKASRAAYAWDEEAAEVASSGRSLTELRRVGPAIERIIASWLEDPPEVSDPPALRAGFITVADARSTLESTTGWRAVRGDLQMHTVYSDGSVSLEEMARAGMSMGYEYFAITDHSKGLKIAGGMDEAILAIQAGEIDELNATFAKEEDGFELLASLEMNLSPDGSGDMDADALRGLDIVLGSFHSQLRKKEDQTERYLAALHNPDIQVLGHPRGRMYNFRAGLDADWERVFAEASSLGKAVEIDCYPDRQDLNVDLVRLANQAGCTFSIGTDSHAPWELEFMDVGLAIAIKAGVERDRILNFAPADEVRRWASNVRSNA